DLLGITAVPVSRNHNWSGHGAFWHARDQKIVRADQHRAFHLSELHTRTAQLRRAQSGADDANIASWQSSAGGERINARFAIHVFSAEQSPRNSHAFYSRGFL